MTTLITGRAGFIGSHLCERLLAEGHRVIALDLLSSPAWLLMMGASFPILSSRRFEANH
ncbi:MAG: NAD-dependent epimerase/dehydratase family protein [Patescibacteria group bacterium]